MKLSLGGCSEVIYVVKVQVGASKGGCYSQAGGHYLEIVICSGLTVFVSLFKAYFLL